MVEHIWMREVYCESLIELAKNDDRVVLLEADLMRASGTMPFRAEFPERTFDIGIAEANMICIAAGLAAEGFIPFADTFTPFATRRCFDQLAISVAYSKLPVKICGTDPGIAAELNGGTHMSFEDVGIVRNLPGFTIIEPVDSTQLRQAMPFIAAHDGPVYMRLLRKPAEKIYDESYRFQWGKADVLREGSDVAIVGSGLMVYESLEAAELLKNDGISATVVNVHTIKPLDDETLLKVAYNTGAVVAAENHSIINGLGSAVAELFSERFPIPIERVGVRDRFGEVGCTDYLKTALGLNRDVIAEAARKAIARK